jgi:hypothetical protein
LGDFALLGIARHPFVVISGLQHLIARMRQTQAARNAAALERPLPAPLAFGYGD